MRTLSRVVEFKADEWDARAVPYLQKDETVRGIVTGFTMGDDSKAIVTAIIGTQFHKFYKWEDDLKIVEIR